MDLSSLTGMFVGVHMMVAAKTNTPELAISLDEGAAFMGAAQNVMRHYSVEATQKTLDWIALAGIAGGMYLTRGVAIANRRSQEKAERQAAGNGQVLRFRRPKADLSEVPAGDQLAGDQLAGVVVGGASPNITLDPFATGGFQPEGEPA